MYYTTQNAPGAWIVDSKDRGRKKIYLNNKVYLTNNQEFLIELFNPTQNSVLAEIKVNGNNATGNGLILRPGERFYLDCFVGDKRKFLFKTYEIENTSESLNATANNGIVEVSFYKERIVPRSHGSISGNSITILGNNPYTNTYTDLNKYKSNSTLSTTATWTINNSSSNNINVSNTSSLGNISNCYYSSNSDNTIHYGDYLAEKLDSSISYADYLAENIEPKTTETGRVEKGNKSNQKFEAVSMDFESYSFHKISYQILPESKKPIETKELKKNFCSECGNKLKGTEKFCPSCGTRI